MEQINLPNWEKQFQLSSEMGQHITVNAKQHQTQKTIIKILINPFPYYVKVS